MFSSVTKKLWNNKINRARRRCLFLNSLLFHFQEGILKRDNTAATLEDKFDKTVLPKVMQVKNFGRSGRTKYTHLVDQDTTEFDAAWAQETSQNIKFQLNHAGGMKGSFERPSAKKKEK